MEEREVDYEIPDIESSTNEEDDTGDNSNFGSEINDNLTSSLLTYITIWAITNRIKFSALDELLVILNDHNIKCPKRGRTLLQTNRIPKNIQGNDNYLYYYFSWLPILQKIIQNTYKNSNNFQLSLNIDGLPLFKSSQSSVWPILLSIKKHIIILAMTYGKKPSDLTFLKDSIVDLKTILTEGLDIDDRHINFQLANITCDAPAKAFIKATKMFNAKHGCDRCSSISINVSGTATYRNILFTSRNNCDFRSNLYVEHQKSISPLVDLPIDMITCFNIDYMHCVLLGVTKKLLRIYLNKEKAIKPEYKLSDLQINRINNRLEYIKKSITNDFCRKTRTLNELDRFKATELRQFLLYSGRTALKGILHPEYYNHFLIFNVAISILVSPFLSKDVNLTSYAHKLLEYFIEEGIRLFGVRFAVYNVHSLLHLKEDVLRLGSLDGSSAFKFENYMQVIKKMVRSGKFPLTQISNRLEEYNRHIVVDIIPEQCKAISLKYPNNCYIYNDTFCEIIAFSNNIYTCKVYKSKPYFDLDSFKSDIIGNLTSSKYDFEMNYINASSTFPIHKGILIKSDDSDEYVFSKILHC